MKPDVGDLPFAVELKLQLSQLSFGEHVSSEIISPTSDFSKLDTMGEPVFAGRCFFGRNNLGKYPDENFGINCQCHDYEESRISDGILGTVFNIDKADYSFAQVYAENERSAQVDIFLNPNILKKFIWPKTQ